MTSKPVSFRVFDLRLFGLLSEFGEDPGITLLRYDRNADGLTSEKWSMYDHNADENGQKFRQVRYCVGTNGTVGWEVRSTMGTNVVNLGRQIFI